MARRALAKRKALIAGGGMHLNAGEEDLARLSKPRNSNKKHGSVMLTNCLTNYGFSESIFECNGA